MSWRLAESLETLKQQVNEKYPGRDTSSDGSIGDTAHSARKSDHNPNAAGVVQAIDIDEDLSPEINSIQSIVDAICASRDARVKYIIYEGRITVAGTNLQQWKPYVGANAHRHHAHISVNNDPALYDNARPWAIDGIAIPVGQPIQWSILRRGSHGERVRQVQEKLGIAVDGDFGPGTEKAIRDFQTAKDLQVDGQVGPQTRKALGL